jgi:hypothetical protein
MTHVTGRRALLQSAAAAFGGAMLPRIAGTTSSQAQTAKPYEFLVKDLVYSHSGGKDRLARLYQPAGTGPFPAMVQVHGGSWAGNDRTDGQNISLDLVEAGIVVLAIEFRNGVPAVSLSPNSRTTSSSSEVLQLSLQTRRCPRPPQPASWLASRRELCRAHPCFCTYTGAQGPR